MKKDILKVTQKLDIIEDDLATLDKKTVFFSRVEDIREDSVLILPPFRKGEYLQAEAGRNVTARVVSDRIPYLFEAVFLNCITDQIPLWQLSKPSVFNKIQLREDVRLEIGLRVSLEVLESQDERKIIKTLTRDLSAGGVQVLLPQALPVGTIVKINVTLFPDFVFETRGMIIRLMHADPPVDKKFAGIRFLEVGDDTKKRIIRFIFTKQAEIRMKEKEWFT